MNILGTMQLRRDTAANWTISNPILQSGEMGFETDTVNAGSVSIKIGDGVSTWTSLPYVTANGGQGPSVALRGSLTYIIAGAPGVVPGQRDNDVYINSVNGYVYQLISGGWIYQFTIAGTLINFSDEETPTGTMNGSNTAFTLAHTPIAGTLKLYINGIRSQSTDYTVAGTTLTLTNAPLATDNLIVDYRF